VPPGPDIKHTPTGSCAANHHEPLTRARADAAVNRLGNSEMQERYDLDQTPAATPHGDQDEGVHQGPTPQPAHGDQDQGVQENPSR
jgi:hypothetical protein